jgi:hypothetical protein
MIRGKVWSDKTSLSVFTKPGQCAAMHMCVTGIHLTSGSTIFLLDSQTIPIVCYS